MAALTLLSSSETELSLQQHLNIAPDLLANYGRIATDAREQEPLMMAQSVPHQTTDRRRVKVYELRDNDWFDRGTGFCTATWTEVCLLHGILSRLSLIDCVKCCVAMPILYCPVLSAQQHSVIAMSASTHQLPTIPSQLCFCHLD